MFYFNLVYNAGILLRDFFIVWLKNAVKKFVLFFWQKKAHRDMYVDYYSYWYSILQLSKLPLRLNMFFANHIFMIVTNVMDTFEKLLQRTILKTFRYKVKTIKIRSYMKNV